MPDLETVLAVSAYPVMYLTGAAFYAREVYRSLRRMDNPSRNLLSPKEVWRHPVEPSFIRGINMAMYPAYVAGQMIYNARR